MTEERDPKVSRRYRELGAQEPPRELDQAILAAAHRAAEHSHAPLVPPVGRHRWYFAFGAAAILVLAVAVTVQVERRPDLEALQYAPAAVPSDRADNFNSKAEKEGRAQAEVSKPPAESAPPPARERRKAPVQPSAPAVSPPAEVKPQVAEEARADRIEAKPGRSATVENQSKPAPQSTPQADNRETSGVLSSAAEPAAKQAQSAPSADAARTQPAPAARQFGSNAGAIAFGAGVASPEAWLEAIAELRKQARHDEADKALTEFRKQYPDYRISEEMLKKVERPK